MKLYVESRAGEFDFITGEHYGSADFRSGSLIGLRTADRLNVALLGTDMTDTVATFTGTIVGDSLLGTFRREGSLETARFRMTGRRD
jgi:hypothetical protein